MLFEDAWAKTMTWEGKGRIHTVRDDPGGTTKWGISQRAYPNVDVAALTEEEARRLALVDYWNPVNAEGLPPALRWDVFDTAFNAGVGRASKLLQRSINLCRQSLGSVDFIREDGQIGPITLTAASALDEVKLLRVFRAYRREHYLQLAEIGQARFIHGWLKRAEGARNV